jgi:hypothetical protein
MSYFTYTFRISWTKIPLGPRFGRGKNPVKGTPLSAVSFFSWERMKAIVEALLAVEDK